MPFANFLSVGFITSCKSTGKETGKSLAVCHCTRYSNGLSFYRFYVVATVRILMHIVNSLQKLTRDLGLAGSVINGTEFILKLENTTFRKAASNVPSEWCYFYLFIDGGIH